MWCDLLPLFSVFLSVCSVKHMVPFLQFFVILDPNAVKDAPRPVRSDFKYSEPFLYHIPEEMLDEYPEAYKRAFGISTLSQADLNRV